MRRRLVKVLGALCLLVFLTAQSPTTPVVKAQSTGGPSQPIQVDFSGLTVEVYKSAQQQQLISSSNPAKIYDTNNPEGVTSQFLVKFKGVKLKNVSGHTITCSPRIIAKIASDSSPTKILVGSNLGYVVQGMSGIANGQSVEIPSSALTYVPYASGIRDLSKGEVIMAKTGGAGGKLEITVGNISNAVCGGSNFTSKAPRDNILWPALRAKVTHNVNGQQVPFANTQVKICRPNAAGLCGVGSADAGLNGFTDANGYFALALAQQPASGTTYAITTAAANGQPARSLGTKTIDDFKHYDIEVSTDASPDLALDLSGAYGVVGGQQQAPVVLSKEYKDIVIKNIVVKNVGTGASPPTTLGLDNSCGEEVAVTVPTIAGNAQVSLEATFTAAALKKIDLELACYIDEADPDKSKHLEGLIEKVPGEPDPGGFSYGNNESIKKNFFTYATLTVEVIDQAGSAVQDALITLTDKKDRKQVKAATDEHGELSISVLRIPGEYTIKISFRGQSDIATKEVQISQPTQHREKVTINPRSSVLFRVNIKAPNEFSNVLALTYAELRTGGQTKLTIKTDKNKTVTVSGDAKGAPLPRSELADATTFHIENIDLKITFDYGTLLKNEDVTWSLKPSAEEHTYQIADLFSNGAYPDKEVESQLETKCQPLVPGSIEVCIHEDAAGLIEAQKLLPTIGQELARLQSFADPVKLTVTEKVLISPYILGSGMFMYDRPDRLSFSRVTKINPLVTRDIVIHEAMHAIDHQLASAGQKFYTAENLHYKASADLTAEGSSLVSAATGAWAWKNLGHTCALFPSNTKCAGHPNPKAGAAEIFAEQITNVCLGLPVSERLADASAIWRQMNPAAAEPPDLLAQRDVIASRGTGAASTQGIGWVIHKINSVLPLSVTAESLSPVQLLIKECQRTAPK